LAGRLIVEVRFGPTQGRKAIVEPGGRLVVGRSEPCDMAFPNDLQLAVKHFTLTWIDGRCELLDHGSAGGTRLHGELVTRAEVPHGGWIRAGQTDLLVHVEGGVARPRTATATPANDVDDGLDPALRARKERLRAERASAATQALVDLRAEARTSRLYAVLDTARSPRIQELLRQNVEVSRSLFDGARGESMSEVAPHIVGPLRDDSELLEALIREGFGARWGIFVATPGDTLDSTRRHLRRFLIVEREDTGDKLYFRFYDPKVASVFFASATPRQSSHFLLPFQAVLVEDPRRGLARFPGGEAAPC
jgi:hypothetical protein